MIGNVMVQFDCNGAERRISVETDTLLLHALRDELGLTGAKYGCGTGHCGACTVLIDGARANACLVFAVECGDCMVVTPDSMKNDEIGRLVIEELVEHGAVQCGICTPGFVLTATVAIRASDGPLTRAQITDALAGNLCRCTGYAPIVEAVKAASLRASEIDSQA